ncbi:MAG: YceI family protein [Cytophagaceae bacterium]|nr:YceI family protein [Cytophagaceae bacterium]
MFSTIAFSQNWELNKPASKISFVINNAGMSVDGSFSDFSGSMVFNPADIAHARISGEVKVSTINTGNEKRDNHLRGDTYFNSERFPVMTFVSKKITATSDNNKYILTGDLKIKGITKEVSIPFTFIEKNNEGNFTCTFIIDRLDYGVGNSSWILSDKVVINLNIQVSKK